MYLLLQLHQWNSQGTVVNIEGTYKGLICTGFSERDKNNNKKIVSLFLSLQENMYLRHMLDVCDITDLHNLEGNYTTHIFIYPQGFTVIGNLTMLCVKDILHMIKYNNQVPNKEARLGTIHQRSFQALVWWVKDFQRRGLEITAAAWNTTNLMSYIPQINIESPLGGDIKVAHPGKVETGHK